MQAGPEAGLISAWDLKRFLPMSYRRIDKDADIIRAVIVRAIENTAGNNFFLHPWHFPESAWYALSEKGCRAAGFGDSFRCGIRNLTAIII